MKKSGLTGLLLITVMAMTSCVYDRGHPVESNYAYLKNTKFYRTSLSDDGIIHSKNIETDPGSGGLLDQFVVFAKVVDTDFDVAGRSIQYSGLIKTEGITEGYAGLWLKVEGRDTTLQLENMTDRGLTGDNGWTRVSVKMEIPDEFGMVMLGGLLTGDGQAWFKDLRITPTDGRGSLERKIEEPAPEEIAWLRQYIIPLRTCVADGGQEDDLRKLAEMIGNAPVVGLGEVTHVSRNIFQMKHCIVRYLRENLGFDIFSIEASMPDAYRVDDYVTHGKGDPAELVKGMIFWTWSTYEVLHMVKWMRDHNINSPDKIRFTGFDMQSFETALGEVGRAMKEIAGAGEILSGLGGLLGNIYVDPDKEKIREELSKLRQIAEAGRPDNKEWTLQMLRVLSQFTDNDDNWHRDKCMAENALWIRENNPGSKIALWAHNGHLQKTGRMMGQHLAEEVGEDYVNIGFAFHKGSYTAVGNKGLTSYEAEVSPPGSFEYFLHLAGEPLFAIDLRKAAQDDSPHGQWLKKKMLFRGTGAMGGGMEFWRTTITDDFDILIFMEESSHSVLLPQ